jgi:hypothetical protein
MDTHMLCQSEAIASLAHGMFTLHQPRLPAFVPLNCVERLFESYKVRGYAVVALDELARI